jgi:hypothetical protein
MIIRRLLDRGGVRWRGLSVFGVGCVDLRQPPQICLPFSGIHVLKRPQASLFCVTRNRPYEVSATAAAAAAATAAAAVVTAAAAAAPAAAAADATTPAAVNLPS